MKAIRKFPALLLLTAAGFAAAMWNPSASMAQSPANTGSPEACKQFVQQFYDAYLAADKAALDADNHESAYDITLRDKKSNFSPELIAALQEDEAAAKKSPGEIVGLDFDPILAAQDIPERYVIGNVQTKGDRYLVEVFGFWNGKKNSKPDVVPELTFQNGNWVFANFHYGESEFPVNENLISVLKALKESRDKTAKTGQ